MFPINSSLHVSCTDAASLIFCTQPFDTFNNGSIKVSWNLPVISPQCCISYSLKLTPQNNSSPLLVFNSTNNSTIITGLVRDVTYAARVMCVTPKGTVLTSEPRDIKNGMYIGSHTTIYTLYSYCRSQTDAGIGAWM